MKRLSQKCTASITKAPCRRRPLSAPVSGLYTFQRNQSNDTSSSKRSFPFEGYFEDMLDKPLHSVAPQTKTPPAPPPPDDLPMTDKEERIAKARVVFGSRLAGPGERRREIEKASQDVAGIMVPPKPEEPDNCCMSGCVNCVWDQFRDELEEWAEQTTKARLKLQEQREKGSATGMMAKEQNMPNHVAVSMDDDGGGTETNWEAHSMESFGSKGEDLFAGIPVGIREFMKTEKMLKEKHKREREREREREQAAEG